METEWDLKDEYSSFGITAKVYRSTNSKINEKFDIGIFFGTFESRGLVGSSLLNKNSCKNTVITYFHEAIDTTLRMEYDERLIEQVKSCTEKKVFQISDVSIKDIETVLYKIISKIPKDCFRSDSKWFIDLGGSPIPYFLGLVAHIRHIFPRPKMVLLNPTGNYDKAKGGYDFTSGTDKNTWIPYYWGNWNPSLPKMYVFLLGFDGERSYEIFNKCEPDNIKVVLTKPGYKKEYENEAIDRNEAFLLESGIRRNNKLDTKRVYGLDASNLVDTWKVLDILYNNEKEKFNVVFVPLGTKGQALSCGLSSLANNKPAVLYHIPQVYNVRDVSRGKYLWKYEITL
jgi:hypothetical protein